MSGGFEQRPGTGHAGPGRSSGSATTPGKSTLTGLDPPCTTRDLDSPEHDAVPSRVAERDHHSAPRPNAAFKVIVYDKSGKLLNIWTSPGVWEGPLPQHFQGELTEHGWTWNNRNARSTRVNTKADGSGGTTVEAWAARLHGVRVEIYAESLDAVARRPDEGVDTHAPGHGNDATNTRDQAGGDSRGAARDEHPTDGVAGDAERTSDGGGAHAGDIDADALELSDPEGDQLADEFERALGILTEPNGGADQGDGDHATSGHGQKGGDPVGRTGPDASIDGTGPGGPRAKDGGWEQGSETARGNDGTTSGDKDGLQLGSEGGRFAGEGREGDQGVRGAGALFGGVIAVPTALQGAVELALLINSGDITGAAGSLFAKGVGKGLSIAAARKLVAHEARIFAAKEMRVVVKELRRSPAFAALAKAERDQVLRITYWETQRRYFRAFLDAAKQEQRAVKTALRKAKPGQTAALETRRTAADAGVEIASVEPVAGRLPVNHAYAGHEFPRELLPPKYRQQGLRFKDTGYPDFEPYAMQLPNGKKTVQIELTGSLRRDAAAANKAAGLKKQPKTHTWHHVEDGGTMMLIPSDLHRSVAHTGGRASYRHTTGIPQYGD